MSGWTVIAHQELASDQAKFTFSNIPQTYTDLYIVISTRSAFSSSGTPFTVIAPNGSLLNLTFRRLSGNGSTAGSDTAPYSVPTPSSLDTANTFSNGSIYIPNYTSSNNKSFSVDAVDENNGTEAVAQIQAGLWSQTAAITSIEIQAESGTGNLKQYSSVTLYGITKGSSGGVTVS